MSKKARHKWTYNDHVLVCYLYLYPNDPEITLELVVNHIEHSDVQAKPMKDSVSMRMANFQYADGKGGLSAVTQDTRSVLHKYSSISREMHREECLRIMGIKQRYKYLYNKEKGDE